MLRHTQGHLPHMHHLNALHRVPHLWCAAALLLPCSVPVMPLEPRFPDYASEPIMWDAAFRQQLLDGLVELGYAVESAFDDTPQDIEGVWLGGRFAVVQSRPQVMAAAAGSGGKSSGAASSAGRQRAKALAAAEAAEAAAAAAAVRETGPGLGIGGSGEWEYEW